MVTTGQKKPININILGGTVSGTNRNLPWDKQDPFLGQTGTHARDKLAVFFLFSSTAPFCPVCPWDRWGLSLGRLSRKGRRQINVLFIAFLLPELSGSKV